MSIPPSGGQACRCRAGPMSRARPTEADADYETTGAGQGAGAVALPGLRPGAASGAALRDGAQRQRLFLGSRRRSWKRCGRRHPRAAASGCCCGPASRSPTPISSCGCGKPHAAARLFGEALAELDTLERRKAIAGGDGFADGFPTAALAARLKAKLGQPSLSKADWVEIGADRPNMKQNADFGVSGLDRIQNMHYCAY